MRVMFNCGGHTTETMFHQNSSSVRTTIVIEHCYFPGTRVILHAYVESTMGCKAACKCAAKQKAVNSTV